MEAPNLNGTFISNNPNASKGVFINVQCVFKQMHAINIPNQYGIRERPT